MSLFVDLILVLSICDALKWKLSDQALPTDVSQQCIGTNTDGSVYLMGANMGTNAGIVKWNGKLPISFRIIPGQNPTEIFECTGQQSVSVDNWMYIVGAYEGNYATPSGKVYIFDMQKEAFLSTEHITKMPIPSVWGCVATDNTNIYYIGGYPQQGNLIQIFNIALQTWNTQKMPILPQELFTSSCMIINGILYSFGGLTPYNIEMSAIFKYDINANVVYNKSISNLAQPTSESKAIRFNDNVFIIGGTISGGYSKVITIFDSTKEEINVLNNVSDLVYGITWTTVAMINYTLMTFGGFPPQKSNKNVEISNELKHPFDFKFINDYEIHPTSYLLFHIVYNDNYNKTPIVTMIFNSNLLNLHNKQIIVNTKTEQCVIIVNTVESNNCSEGIYINKNMSVLPISNNNYPLYVSNINYQVVQMTMLHRTYVNVSILFNNNNHITFGNNIKISYNFIPNNTFIQSNSTIFVESHILGLQGYILINYETKICEIRDHYNNLELCENGISVTMQETVINTKIDIGLSSDDTYLVNDDVTVYIEPCVLGQYVVGSQCVLCPYNSFSLKHNVKCSECNGNDIGYECLGGSNILITYGYWISVNNYSLNYEKIFDNKYKSQSIISSLCPNNFCCTNSNVGCYLNDSSNLCALNRNQNSILCGLCADGYSEVFGSNECAICDDNRWYLLLIPIIFSFIYTLILSIDSCSCSCSVCGGHKKKDLDFPQEFAQLIDEEIAHRVEKKIS